VLDNAVGRDERDALEHGEVASGAIGRQLVPILSSIGHDVVALSRRRPTTFAGAVGAIRSCQADALDAAAMERLVGEVHPNAIVNLLTAIPAELDPRRLKRDFELTNRLRQEGTANLLAAAQGVPGAYMVSEGLAYAYEPAPSPAASSADEDTPLWTNPPRQFAPNVEALRVLEERTVESGGAVLRIGHLYGPGTSYAADGSFTRQVRAGRVPLVGGGTSVFSFSHVYDVATAIVAALDRRPVGPLNVVDDDPAPMSTWLPYFADVVGAPRPKPVPAVLARMAVGGFGVAYMTRLRGADNARARLSLDWRPRYTSWRDGFEELRDRPPAS
jgi:nucleoside-diphosphate-sugar epimerase